MAVDLYTVLGVPKDADEGTIKRAYRKLAKDLHPDKNPGNPKAEDRFKSVNQAYTVLSDPKKRKLYDEFGEEALREGFDADRVRQYRHWASQQGQGPTVNLEDLFGRGRASEGGVADLFGDLFGRGRRARVPVRGADIESDVTIDLAQALQGTTLELRIQGGPAGPVTVRIPPGADEGSRLRIPGHGAPSPAGGPPGDLVLRVHVRSHAHFRREGDDLHLDLPLTLAEAYRGAKVRVPTVDGAVTLTVPERTQSGQVARLRGKGVSRKGKPPGDLYVHFLVQVPTAAGPEVEQLIERLAGFQQGDPRADIKL